MKKKTNLESFIVSHSCDKFDEAICYWATKFQLLCWKFLENCGRKKRMDTRSPVPVDGGANDGDADGGLVREAPGHFG